jgi:hypothetical protein
MVFTLLLPCVVAHCDQECPRRYQQRCVLRPSTDVHVNSVRPRAVHTPITRLLHAEPRGGLLLVFAMSASVRPRVAHTPINGACQAAGGLLVATAAPVKRNAVPVMVPGCAVVLPRAAHNMYGNAPLVCRFLAGPRGAPCCVPGQHVSVGGTHPNMKGMLSFEPGWLLGLQMCLVGTVGSLCHWCVA